MDLVDEGGLPPAVQRAGEGLPVGVELVRADERDDARARVRLHQGQQVPERRRDGHGLRAGAQRHRPELRDGVGRAPAREPVPPLLVPPGEPEVPAAAARVVSGGPNSGFEDPYMQSAGPQRLRAAEVLPRQRRGLVSQRGDDQLERAAVLGGRVPRREGRPQGAGKGKKKWRLVPSPRLRGEG